MTAQSSRPSGHWLGTQAERFDVGRLLGEGGMGVVHEALDRRTGRQIAMKMLRDLDTDSRTRFKREFRALQGVRHARLVRLHELFEEDGSLFFTMDLDTRFPGGNFTLGGRNSHDKTMALGITAGYRVFVCENGAFHGDYTPVIRKHTRNLDLYDVLSTGVENMVRNF